MKAAYLFWCSFLVVGCAITLASPSISATPRVIAVSPSPAVSPTSTRTPTVVPSPTLVSSPTPIHPYRFGPTQVALVQTVRALSLPYAASTLSSPDGKWRAELIDYDCEQTLRLDTNVVITGSGYKFIHSQLRLSDVLGQSGWVVAENDCDPIDYIAFRRFFWSPNAQYLYFGDGFPELGPCVRYNTPFMRLNITERTLEHLESETLSPNGKFMAAWYDGFLQVWSLDGPQVAQILTLRRKIPQNSIVWSPDSQSLAYMQKEHDCFEHGKTTLVRVDVLESQQSILFETDESQFIRIIEWTVAGEIKLEDESYAQWVYDLATGELLRVP